MAQLILTGVALLVDAGCVAQGGLAGASGAGRVTSATAVEIPIGDAGFKLSPSGQVVGIRFDEGTEFTSGSLMDSCLLKVDNGSVGAARIEYGQGALEVEFREGSRAKLRVESGDGFTLFKLTSLDLKSSATGMEILRLPVPALAKVEGTLNMASAGGKTVGAMAASPELVPLSPMDLVQVLDMPGCSHEFVQTTESKVGNFAARFAARSTISKSGWNMQGLVLGGQKLKMDQVAGLSAWIHGDGQGQSLKFQLMDDGGGARDYYVPVDFNGWRRVEMTSPALSIVKGEHLKSLNIYYNGVPPMADVVCLVDDIQALVVDAKGTSSRVELEGFEDDQSAWWTNGSRWMGLAWDFRHVGIGAAFGIFACDTDKLMATVQQFEKAAGIVTPYIKGEWNKTSQARRESYLFLTSFKEDEFDEGLALAKRGGFRRVLLGQESWCKSTGHYEVNPQRFSGGLEGLVKTVKRFRAEGIDVGLHLLGASIDWNDAYITPVPDARLVKDAWTTLTQDMDEKTTTIVVASMPDKFPAEDGGYMGHGRVLQVGDELISYGARSTEPPYVFSNCVRGHLGTKPAAHRSGEAVAHLARSYGYHMMDLDTTLLDEVTSNFAKVANACDIGMIYFDGSEALQGDHTRYNARLINGFVSKLDRKDILLQASSFSHFSWHQLARAASADGHGDLKGYLEQRSPAFDSYRELGMPLDIGWYYGYDTSATLDMYEYILGTTLGYDSSFSYQVSVAAAKKHPFTGQILDLIKRYEDLRLAGGVSAAMRALLQVPKELQGKAPDDPTRQNDLRRDYRLVSARNGAQAFQRVIYGDWQVVTDVTSRTAWTVDVTTRPVQMGVQIHLADTEGSRMLVDPWVEVDGNRLTWKGSIRAGQYVTLWPGEVGVLNAPGTEAVAGNTVHPALNLNSGQHEVRFGYEAGGGAACRVRVNLVAPERHMVESDPR